MEITFDFDKPVTEINRGRVFLNGRFLANLWTEIAGANKGKWFFNRDSFAFELGIEPAPFFVTLDDLRAWVQTNLTTRGIQL